MARGLLDGVGAVGLGDVDVDLSGGVDGVELDLFDSCGGVAGVEEFGHAGADARVGCCYVVEEDAAGLVRGRADSGIGEGEGC